MGFPSDVVARIMIREIFNYLSTNKKSSIQEVFLMIYMKDTLKSFEGELGAVVHGVPSVEKQQPIKKRQSNFSQTAETSESGTDELQKSFSVKKITVNVLCGDITASKCDVIVNPTDSKLTLTGHGVASAILRKGGNELKLLCDVLTSNEKTLDDSTLVLETKATGLLKSKSVFHICFEGTDSKKFGKIITECLQKAEKMRYYSIAFPAIGTGVHLRYPDEQAAVGMLKAIEEFSKQPNYLKQIDIVLFQKSIYQIFTKIFENPSASESFLTKAIKWIGYGSESSVVPISWPLDHELQHDKLNIIIYGENVQLVETAERKFYNFMDEIFVDDAIDDPWINELTKEDEYELKGITKQVRVRIDRHPINRILLTGEASKVQEVKYVIAKRLGEIAQKAGMIREAGRLYQTIKWKRVKSDDDMEEYDEMVNFELESSYNSNPKGTYTHGSANSVVYFTIDFAAMCETDHCTKIISKVIREDALTKGTNDVAIASTALKIS